VNKVTTPDIAKLHRKLRDHPYQAKRMLAVVSALYGYAAKHHVVPADFPNPAANVEKYPERKREKFLSSESQAMNPAPPALSVSTSRLVIRTSFMLKCFESQPSHNVQFTGKSGSNELRSS
jgi:hypothetical protein